MQTQVELQTNYNLEWIATCVSTILKTEYTYDAITLIHFASWDMVYSYGDPSGTSYPIFEAIRILLSAEKHIGFVYPINDDNAWIDNITDDTHHGNYNILSSIKCQNIKHQNNSFIIIIQTVSKR